MFSTPAATAIRALHTLRTHGFPPFVRGISAAGFLFAFGCFTAAPICGASDAMSTQKQPNASYSPRKQPALSRAQMQAMVVAWRAGYHYGFPDTFAALVYIESSECKNAVKSSAGALGCAQVLPTTATEIAGTKIPDWQLSAPSFKYENMALGAKYLDLCFAKFGWPAGIGCYKYGLHTKLNRSQLSRLRYTRAVLDAVKWIRNLPNSEQ